MSHPSIRVVVVGGGIVGLATALKLLRRRPELSVLVVEKEAAVGRHQTGHNSGVLHAGLYYRPGSAKARLAVAGIREMVAFCQEHGVPHEICGKLVVAVDQPEQARLAGLCDRGNRNGLRGLEMLRPEQIREIEPHAGGIAALRVPEEGIVDFGRVCAEMVRLIRQAGGEVVTGARVDRLSRRPEGWVVGSDAGEWQADLLLACAGLHADRVLRLAGEACPARIVPFRGEYFRLRSGREHLVRHLIYPVPDASFPFLGVHFTRMIGGGIEAGPNAVLALAREGYTKGRVNLADLADAVGYAGLWRFLAAHPRATWDELRRSFSRRKFAASLARLVPEIDASDLTHGGAGVRAQAMRPGGTLVEDFLFVDGHRAIHVLNAPSPAATASLAIGDEIAARACARLA